MPENTFIKPNDITAGQVFNIIISTTGSGTVTFPSTVKQTSGSLYIPTTTTSTDVLTFIAPNTSSLLLASVKNLV
jgi:hypothetical protein